MIYLSFEIINVAYFNFDYGINGLFTLLFIIKMIKTYKEYIDYHSFGKNQGGKINFIRMFIDDINNNKYNLKDKQKDEILEKLYDIENDILDKINDGLDKALLIKASIS